MYVVLLQPPVPGHGAGRVARLDSAVTLRDAVHRVKTHLQLTHVRLAVAAGATLGQPELPES